MNDDFLTIYLKGLEDGKEKKKQEIKMLEDENKKYKEVLDKIKEMLEEEWHEDGCEFCLKLEKLLEEIE